MQFNYGGKVDVSTIDWYGRAATVLFFRGCQMRCIYCHNRPLVEGRVLEDIETMRTHLEDASMMVGAVVFCGGEPTLQPDAIRELSRIAHDLGLDVGLNTNGLRPEVLKGLMDDGLLDFVSVDAKAPLMRPDLYGRICLPDAPAHTQREVGEKWCALVRESLQLLDGSIEAEVRTTVFESVLSPDHVGEIAQWLAERDVRATYVLQQGMPTPMFHEPSPSSEYMNACARSACSHFPRVVVRDGDGEREMCR